MATLYADTPGQYGQMLQARRKAQADAMNRAAELSARMAFDAQSTRQDQLNQRANIFENALQARQDQEQREAELRREARQLQERDRAQQIFTLERDAAQQKALKERDKARFDSDEKLAKAEANAKAKAYAEKAMADAEKAIQQLANQEFGSITREPNLMVAYAKNPSLFPNLNADTRLRAMAEAYIRNELLRQNKETREKRMEQFLGDDPDQEFVGEDKESAIEDLRRIFGDDLVPAPEATTRREMLPSLPSVGLTEEQKDYLVFKLAAQRAAAERAAAERAAAQRAAAQRAAAQTSGQSMGPSNYPRDVRRTTQAANFNFNPATGELNEIDQPSQ